MRVRIDGNFKFIDNHPDGPASPGAGRVSEDDVVVVSVEQPDGTFASRGMLVDEFIGNSKEKYQFDPGNPNLATSEARFAFLASHLPQIDLARALTAEPHEKTDLPGDPRLGKVRYLRQVHPLPWDLPSEVLDVVGIYHFLMLQELEKQRRKNPRQEMHLFVEALDRDVPPGGLNPGYVGQVRRSFSKGITSSPSSLQLIALRETRAPYVFAALYDNVFLHGATTTAIRDRREAGILRKMEEAERQGLTPEQFDETLRPLHMEVERDATSSIVSFMRENPQIKEVVLILGGAHDIADDFQSQGFTPEIRSLCWKIPASEMDKLPRDFRYPCK